MRILSHLPFFHTAEMVDKHAFDRPAAVTELYDVDVRRPSRLVRTLGRSLTTTREVLFPFIPPRLPKPATRSSHTLLADSAVLLVGAPLLFATPFHHPSTLASSLHLLRTPITTAPVFVTPSLLASTLDSFNRQC